MTARRSILVFLALVAASLLAFASPASAAENPDYTSSPPEDPVVVPSVIRRAPSASASAAATASESAAVSPAAQRQTLAITGSDVAGFVVIGTILLAGGAGLLVMRRRVAV